jgi:hypothetical protein
MPPVASPCHSAHPTPLTSRARRNSLSTTPLPFDPPTHLPRRAGGMCAPAHAPHPAPQARSHTTHAHPRRPHPVNHRVASTHPRVAPRSTHSATMQQQQQQQLSMRGGSGHTHRTLGRSSAVRSSRRTTAVCRASVVWRQLVSGSQAFGGGQLSCRPPRRQAPRQPAMHPNPTTTHNHTRTRSAAACGWRTRAPRAPRAWCTFSGARLRAPRRSCCTTAWSRAWQKRGTRCCPRPTRSRSATTHARGRCVRAGACVRAARTPL